MLLAVGAGGAFLVWLAAMATWFPLATRLRNIAEHACVASDDDPYTHARTTRANPIERALIAPVLGQPPRRAPPVHVPALLPVARGAPGATPERGLAGRIKTAPGYLACAAGVRGRARLARQHHVRQLVRVVLTPGEVRGEEVTRVGGRRLERG